MPERDVERYVAASIALAQQREPTVSKTNRIKTDAATFACRSREEVDACIKQIGDAQRRREEIRTAMNEELAAVKARYEEQAAPHSAVIKELGEGVRIWCEANRAELTRDGKTKTARLQAGEIRWRLRPPSVSVRAAGLVIEALKRLGLDRFIRTKEEIDKDAILAEPGAVQDVKGISVVQGEDFVIVPFATELEEVS
jgi:phage host-nuclease inhibitor protein Gam